MARYRVVGMNKGDREVLKTFARRKDAEAYVRLIQGSSRYGAITINEDRSPQPVRTPPPAGTPDNPMMGRRSLRAVSIAYVILSGIAILVGAAFVIDFLNSVL